MKEAKLTSHTFLLLLIKNLGNRVINCHSNHKNTHKNI
jgi:hypothetical protein